MLENLSQLLLGETMYGYRNSNAVRNFILTFLAGWLFGQVFTIQPKGFDSKPIQQTLNKTR